MEMRTSKQRHLDFAAEPDYETNFAMLANANESGGERASVLKRVLELLEKMDVVG